MEEEEGEGAREGIVHEARLPHKGVVDVGAEKPEEDSGEGGDEDS